jgi:endonuclease/exonuclease/phosphatase family metal-dependent hydrolase
MRFRLVTWNMHKGIGGLDGQYNIHRVIRTLEQCHPDIVHLQEVDDDAPRSRHHRQVDVLAEALALPHRAYQPNVTLRRGAYGNAVISRFPLHPARNLDLTWRFKKRRGAQIVSAAIPVPHRPHQPVMLVNLHLGLIEFEQKIQLRRLLACDEVKSLEQTVPLIIAGDMNDVLGRLGRHILEPQGYSSAANGKYTFPAFFPVRALDQIFYRGGLALRRCFIPHSLEARQASDHLPLIADFEIAGAKHAETGHSHRPHRQHPGE